MGSSSYVEQDEIMSATNRMRELFNGILEIKSRAEGRAHGSIAKPSVMQLLQGQKAATTQISPEEQLASAISTPVNMDISELTGQNMGFQPPSNQTGGA